MSQDCILHSSIGYSTGSCDILAELQLFAAAVARSAAVTIATTSTTPSTGVVPSSSSTSCSVIWLWLTSAELGLSLQFLHSCALLCSKTQTVAQKTPQTVSLLTVLTVLPVLCEVPVYSSLRSSYVASFLYRIVCSVYAVFVRIDRSVRSIFPDLFLRIFRILSVAALPASNFGCLYSAAIYTLSLDRSVDIDLPLLQFSGFTLPLTVSQFPSRKLFWFFCRTLPAVLCLVLEAQLFIYNVGLQHSKNYIVCILLI